MSFIGLDLGATKINAALFSDSGEILITSNHLIGNKEGFEIGLLIQNQINSLILESDKTGDLLHSLGISVPGIFYSKSGNVWAPNIAGWEDYPLLHELETLLEGRQIKIRIDSDRACSILGEVWKGNAKGCKNAIFMTVGTGIGAGILIDGQILRGANDIAGCIGWMALDRPFQEKYTPCGCYEYYASGEGLVRFANEELQQNLKYSGVFNDGMELNATNLIREYEAGDEVAQVVIDRAIEYWGMATANLVSLFNPEKIIFGGGVFGKADRFLDRIRVEARKWAQPIGFSQVSIEVSAIGPLAALYGAGYLAIK
ncbi:MAG TPA: ROK family protein [Prolixibacteraceae bacterium]|nr:ROK family protein [Prolixibacteraceae bacterium]